MNQVAISAQTRQIAQTIDSAVSTVLTANSGGFELAFIKASAMDVISNALTDEYMKPILALQNKKIGFLTDAPEGGYKIEIVKHCIIEAILNGLEVTGNHFNIIAGKMYPTREGYTHLLFKIKGLVYKLTPSIPKFVDGACSVSYKIWWRYAGEERTEELIFPIRVNKGMGDDAILGKAERKAKKWLYTEITKTDISDGEAEIHDISHEEIKDKKPVYDIKSTSESKSKPSDGTVFEPVKESDSKPKEKSKRQIEADAYLDKATTVEDLEKRLKQASRIDNFDDTFYKEKLAALQK